MSESEEFKPQSKWQAWGTVAANIALYLLLADAAVETFLSGSPVRWWVGLTVLAYLAASGALWWLSHPLWHRYDWGAKAFVSVFVLLGLLALTVWRPGGLAQGLTLLALSTSTLLSLVTAAGVAFAGYVLLRLTYPHPAIRWAVLGVSGYGAIAFLWAVIGGTPYASLFQGESFWTWLPWWLQGAFLGGLILIPAALAVLVSDALRHLRGAELRAWAVKALVLFLCLDLVLAGLRVPRSFASGQASGEEASHGDRPLFALPDKAELATAGDVDSQVPPRYALTATEVHEVITGFQKIAAHIPKLPYDLAARAKALGPGIEPAFFYVRDQIAYESYLGVLRGAEGAYLSRAGNAFDRSLLLAELLRQKGVATRFAMCRLLEERAEELFDRIFEPPGSAVVNASLSISPFQERLKKRAVRDYAAIRKALGDDLPFRASPTRDEVTKEIQDHVWVQAQTDKGWVDLDSSFPQAEPGKSFCAAARTVEKIPPEKHQRVTIRVIIETLSEGSLKTETMLSETRSAVELIDRHIFLLHAPGTGEGGLAGGVGSGILGKDAWTPMLFIHGEFIKGKPIAFSDQTGPQRGKPPGGGIGGIFGPGGPLAGPERYFVAEWLEFEIAFPNGRRETVRRTLVDRAGMAWRAKSLDPSKLRPLAHDKEGLFSPRYVHNIWFSAGPHDLASYAASLRTFAEFVTDTRNSQNRAASSQTQSQIRPGDLTLEEGLWTVATANAVLVNLSDHLVVPALNDSSSLHFYADSPRVVVVSAGMKPEQTFFMQYDLRRDHLRGLAQNASLEAELIARKIWFGAIEGALEHELAASSFVAIGVPASAVTSTSALLSQAGVIALGPGGRSSGWLAFDPDTAAHIAVAVANGATLVVPRGTLAGAPPAWWEITGAGADTRAVLGGELNGAIASAAAPIIEKKINDFMRRQFVKGTKLGRRFGAPEYPAMLALVVTILAESFEMVIIGAIGLIGLVNLVRVIGPMFSGSVGSPTSGPSASPTPIPGPTPQPRPLPTPPRPMPSPGPGRP